MEGPVRGLRIGVIGARTGAELVDALEGHGAQALWGPTLRSDVPVDDSRLLAETDAVLTAGPSWVVVSTAAGTRAWADAAARHGREAALRSLLAGTTLAARGPKAAAALQPLGVSPLFVSTQATDADVAAWLADRVRPGEIVAVQVHGVRDGGAGDAYDRLGEVGATVLRVAPYRCELPADREPARRLVLAACADELDAVVATSPPAVRNLLLIAEEIGRRRALVSALRETVAVAAVGPVTARAFEDAGAPVAVMPPRPRTGELVRALAGWAQRRDMALPAARPESLAIELVPETRVARVGARAIVLGEREFGVLAALVRRPQVMCSHDLIAREAWGHRAPDDPVRVKHQISRLRRKLGPAAATLQTVRPLGYRYAPTPARP
ncbi:MAG: uroporphyrinogen-III synthase [Actinomycetota bacterium]|nr:uroporphyrinogen-III synthase [Actinomycetota bacterium]